MFGLSLSSCFPLSLFLNPPNHLALMDDSGGEADASPAPLAAPVTVKPKAAKKAKAARLAIDETPPKTIDDVAPPGVVEPSPKRAAATLFVDNSTLEQQHRAYF